jgi:hypothetical protein
MHSAASEVSKSVNSPAADGAAVTEHGHLKLQRCQPDNAGVRGGNIVVQHPRRSSNPAPTAGDGIAGKKHHAIPLQQVRHVSRRMAGCVHGAEAWDGNGAVPGQQVVDRRRLWHRHEDRADPLYGFEDESFCASNDWRVGLVRDHPSTGPAAQLGQASSVVGVLVGQQDGRHIPHGPTDVAQGAVDSSRRTPARQTGIDKYDAIVDHNQVDIHKTDSQLEDTVNDLTHTAMMPQPRSRPTSLRHAAGSHRRVRAVLTYLQAINDAR